MKTILQSPGVGGLLFAQSQVAFNDNAAKLILIGLVQILLPEDVAERWVSAIALLLVAPFVIFAPLSGWLADHFPKRHVLAGSLWLQLAVTLVLCFAVIVHSLPLAIGGFFLLGLQSALMAPARRGMAKELGGQAVGELVGWMEMLCIAAILVGTVAGGQLIDGLTNWLGSAWTASLVSLGLLGLGCLVAIVQFRSVPARPAARPMRFTGKTLWGHADLLRTLRQDRAIWRAALGDSVFYLVGGVLLLTFSQIGRSLHPDGIGAARATGLMLAVIGGGIGLGSVLAARLNRDGVHLGLAPLGALGMAGALGLLSLATPGSMVFLLLLGGLGLAGGMYIVPLGAFLVDRAPEASRGRILAASGLISSIAGVIAVGLHFLLSVGFNLGPSGQFLLLSALMLVTAGFAAGFVPQHLLRMVALAAARLRYDVRRVGRLPESGGTLVVCNHVSYVDTLILSLAANRPIRFLAYEGFFQTPILGSILRLAGCIPVAPNRAKDAIAKACESIRQGEVVGIFPEGQLTRTGCLMELKSGFELISRRTACPVVVAQLDGLWGSIHSFSDGRYFSKWPTGWRRQTTVSFSKPLTQPNTAEVREVMLELGEQAFRARHDGRNLARALFRSLEGAPFHLAVSDISSEKRTLNNLQLLATSLGLAARWRQIPDRRVGILLPPGLAGTLANTGLILAGKIPVNLNPTQDPACSGECLRRAGVTTIITAEIVRRKLKQFPWTESVRTMDAEMKHLSRGQLALISAALLVLPRRILESWFDLPTACGTDEAVLLFTSGTSGQPKGVPLSHDNIVSNHAQVTETSFLKKNDRLLTALPLFHSFGLTMGLLFPLLSRRTVITSPTPLDSGRLAEAARAGLPTVLLSTPTFLRQYTARIPRDAFGTLRLAVAGAERLPNETASAFRARFGCPVFEGYGLTEASPVVSFNLPHPERGPGADSAQIGHRDGSVGRLLPGLAARIFDPENESCRVDRTSGLLALRGSNLIPDYLDTPAPDKFAAGWFHTGDVVRVDAEGFLHLEGRQSRFSKIGGEMVSHSAVESALASTLGAGQDCVIGVPCPAKGETLVLLTTRRLEPEDLRRALTGTVPNLWIPRRVLHLTQLPILASGKLNLAECQRMASVPPATV